MPHRATFAALLCRVVRALAALGSIWFGIPLHDVPSADAGGRFERASRAAGQCCVGIAGAEPERIGELS